MIAAFEEISTVGVGCITVMYTLVITLIAIGAFAYGCKVPERWLPGYFDIIGTHASTLVEEARLQMSLLRLCTCMLLLKTLFCSSSKTLRWKNYHLVQSGSWHLDIGTCIVSIKWRLSESLYLTWGGRQLARLKRVHLLTAKMRTAFAGNGHQLMHVAAFLEYTLELRVLWTLAQQKISAADWNLQSVSRTPR